LVDICIASNQIFQTRIDFARRRDPTPTRARGVLLFHFAILSAGKRVELLRAGVSETLVVARDQNRAAENNGRRDL
jgi:hypothetical protein